MESMHAAGELRPAIRFNLVWPPLQQRLTKLTPSDSSACFAQAVAEGYDPTKGMAGNHTWTREEVRQLSDFLHEAHKPGTLEHSEFSSRVKKAPDNVFVRCPCIDMLACGLFI